MFPHLDPILDQSCGAGACLIWVEPEPKFEAGVCSNSILKKSYINKKMREIYQTKVFYSFYFSLHNKYRIW